MQVKAVVVIGQGYVGLPVAVRAVEVGHAVTGIEVDEARAGRLALGESYVEDIPSERLRACIDSGRYRATADYALAEGFDVAVITVPTPLREGAPDLSHIEDACASLAPHVRPGCTVILESTTYPGTTEELAVPLLERGSGLTAGADFHVGYSPERIDPGNARYHLVNTPKVVSGIDAASLTAVKAFYDSICQRTVPVGDTKVAELTKLLENTFRHVNIALVNELAMFAADLGIDVWEAIEAADTKPFGYMKFTPGPGVGGHCLPVDPSYLSWRVKRSLGQSFRFVELANDVNDHMPDYVARRVTATLNRERKAVNGSRILVLGLAYKKNTGDARESPGPVVVERLQSLGAEVVAADPHVLAERFPEGVERVDATVEELSKADLVVLVTDHDDFDLQAVATASRRVLDTRRRLRPAGNVEFL